MDVKLSKKKVLSKCSAEDCDNVALWRDLCRKHYMRHYRAGNSPKAKTKLGEPRKFLRHAVAAKTAECILWPFNKTPDGYGKIWQGDDHVIVSRYVCEATHGPQPEGHEAAHNCGTRLCCNPAHIEWKTHVENCADKKDHGTGKLDLFDAAEIRKSNSPAPELAKNYNVSQGHINMVKRNKTWRS